MHLYVGNNQGQLWLLNVPTLKTDNQTQWNDIHVEKLLLKVTELSLQAVLVRKERFDAASVLKNYFKVDTRVEIVYTAM